MALDNRLTERSILPDPEPTDIMHVVDISDLTGGVDGTSKQATLRDIVLAGAGSPENQIIINDDSDFAVQAATTITLEKGKVYIPGASISTNKRFIVSEGVTIFGSSFLIDNVWEYTGTDTMFTGTDVEFFVAFNLAIRCPNALQIFSFLDASSPNVSAIILEFCFAYASGPTSIAAKKWGTFNDIGTLSMHMCVVVGEQAGLGIQDGVTLSGTQVNALFFDTVTFTTDESTFIGLDLGSVLITQSFKLDAFITIGSASGAIGISGLSNSANIDSAIIASVRDSEFLGLITPLSGITTSDVLYDFMNSPPLEDSFSAADAFLTAQETVTISDQSIFVPISGVNWSSEVTERFVITTAGVVTYRGTVPIKGQIIMSATVAKDGGGADEIQLAIAINGDVETKTVVGTQNATPTALTSIGIFTLSLNDTIQAFVANDGSTSNIDVFACSIIVTS